MRIAIITGAWDPQMNGVVTTLRHTITELKKIGHEVLVVSPNDFWSFPCPTYPEIRLALPGLTLFRMLDRFAPEAIHIATECTLGWAAKWYCRRRGFSFSSAYHTRFPEYAGERAEKIVRGSYGIIHRIASLWMRAFHHGSSCVMVAASSLQQELESLGFRNLSLWSKGVDHDTFHPVEEGEREGLKGGDTRPIFLYFGRVSGEKNLEAFLALNLPGTKLVVGDGPARKELERRYPDARFLGFKKGKELSRIVGKADVMVFPSRTDTFGLVVIEANACGVPVAAYPVSGPLDLIVNGVNGFTDEDLQNAALKCLSLDRKTCSALALQYTWKSATEQFAANLIRSKSKP